MLEVGVANVGQAAPSFYISVIYATAHLFATK